LKTRRLSVQILAVAVVASIATALSCVPKSRCRALVTQTITPALEGQRTTFLQGLITWQERGAEPVIGAVVKVWDFQPQRMTPIAYPEIGFLAKTSTRIEGDFRVELPQGSSLVWLTVEAAGYLASEPLQIGREVPATVDITLGLCSDPWAERGTDAGTWPPMIDYRSTSD